MRRFVLVLGVLMWMQGCDQERVEPSEVVQGRGDAIAIAIAGGEDSDDAIAELRAEGRDGFQRVLAAYRDPARDGAAADWDRVLDAVAGQRDAAASGLYWETELDSALAAANERELPVLSLRMLGDLTDDLSCANSRFFRTLLYSDPELAHFLDANFVLHWSSERAVPTVTIDFGDGRRITTTTTGNSAHYVLDADGHVLDVLPGLYDADAFQARLERALTLHANIEQAPAQRATLVRAHHRRAAEAIERRMAGSDPSLGGWMRRPPGGTDGNDVSAMDAQPIAISKMRVETPVLRGIEGTGDGPVGDPAPETLRRLAPAVELSPTAIAIIERDRPARPDETVGEHAERIVAVVERTERDLAVDAFVNEVRLHFQVHRWFASGEVDGDFDTLNERVYRELFGTPRSDPWLGLRDDASYDGLREGPYLLGG